jgi:DNA-directed RNA polymerase subunit RPC12/RpoP
MSDHVATRSGWEVRADLVCTLCARTVGSARGPEARPVKLTSVRVPDASHAEAVRRLRCPYCSGRLWFQNHEVIHVDRHTLSAEELRPRAGRRRMVPRAS